MLDLDRELMKLQTDIQNARQKFNALVNYLSSLR